MIANQHNLTNLNATHGATEQIQANNVYIQTRQRSTQEWLPGNQHNRYIAYGLNQDKIM